MFSKIALKSDGQLSSIEIANLLLADALKKMSELSGVNEKDALEMITAQVLAHSHVKTSRQLPSTDLPINLSMPLLEQSEVQFITQLFH